MLHNTKLWNDLMYASQVIFSGIELEPHVDSLSSPIWVLAELLMMREVCRHSRSINYECNLSA